PSPFSRSPAHPHSPSFPTTTLFRSLLVVRQVHPERAERLTTSVSNYAVLRTAIIDATYPRDLPRKRALRVLTAGLRGLLARGAEDRKSTRLNSSHRTISYAVFCLKK